MKGAIATVVLLLLTCTAVFAQSNRDSTLYKIQVDDILRIQVYGEQQINVEVPVDQEGNVSAPFVGTLRAEGRTTAELEQELTAAYRERLRLRDPKVSVTFARFRPIRASVGGAVQRPGQYELRPGDTLLTLLHQAGDPIPSGVSSIAADYRRARLKRKNSEEYIPIDLYAMLYRGDLSQNYVIEDGDQLEVPVENRNNVQIIGIVQRPGQYPYKEGMTLADLVSLSGGEIPRQSKFSQTTITRQVPGSAGQYIRIKANFVNFLSKGDVSQNVLLQPGDFVYVPRTATPDINELSSIVNTAFFIDRVVRDGLFGFRLFR